ncbi:hypothetical protein COY14_03290 [Candidatus Roizmanbacteria bacterium CG_4_10_14_0_2_um_filter_36_9]|uniref:Uncharacterized protein n=1 Tax=Candidatus Roizmanbacteria bacterium CG_4_10_14_0_2_um_filter_36_9 TaxID=1974823 RepID=A0A2M7U3D8_9BACT|nr:MAG: hypothetical protein COY14_03290 [Candidatus Roizmanbacteria bacterium CG_4_10_14_0_2_um_filter_36_9]
MSRPKLYPQRVIDEFENIFLLAPNNLHSQRLNRYYKYLTKPLKSMPFYLIIPLSVSIAMLAYALLGRLIIHLVTLLQHGF